MSDSNRKYEECNMMRGGKNNYIIIPETKITCNI